MEIAVTGAAGFLGQRLIRSLLARGELTGRDGQSQRIEKIRAFDVVPLTGIDDPRVEALTGDISDPRAIDALVGPDTASVFHLAAIVSGQAEQEFDLGMRINFDATRLLLERIRGLETHARFVMTSSVAVFGGALPDTVEDTHVWSPRSSYGTQKALADLLVSDYSRRGYLDGRSLRMPTIVVRPGKPNRAASSFASGIIREPVNGEEAVCPVSADTVLWVMSPVRAVENLVHGHELPGDRLAEGRVINMPGLSVSVKEMLASLRRVAGDAVADRVRFEPDPATEKIVYSWPGNFAADYARSLGFEKDANFDEVVRAFIAHDAARKP
ncbi:MAG TPA: D-erythronate dehydrogenase [Paraburkholderia sp.]